jgi:hypothetical protein
MQLPMIPKKRPTFAKFNQMSTKHKVTAAGAGAAAAVVLTVTGLQATAGAGSASAASSTAGVSASAVTHAKELGARSGTAQLKAATGTTQQKAAPKTALAAPKAQAKADLTAPAKKKAADAAARKAAAETNERAAKKAAANRSAHRAEAVKKSVTKAAPKRHASAPKPAAKTYANNLDGWIRESLDILHKKGIPGTYEGIHRNIIRESSGDPRAINLWDINARNGIPSKGLLQVIDPTFNRFHVAGTSHNIYDPVANITAACNYAADRYGTMDNVNSAY